MQSVFILLFIICSYVNIHTSIVKLDQNCALVEPEKKNKININFFEDISQEIFEKIIRVYSKETKNLIDLKKLRFVSSQFDLICSKIFVEKIDIDHKLFMPWYVQMQLHLCEDQPLKKLFTSFNHESTIFNILTHKFLFVSNIPKTILHQNNFQDFCMQFNIQPTKILDCHEEDLKQDIQNSVGCITHDYYVENYNKKKHSLITFNFKDYQYCATKLPENIYFYLAEIIQGSEDYSLAFITSDDNNFELHQQEKRNEYSKLTTDIINKLSFMHDKHGEKVQDENKKLIPNNLIKKLKNISISFPILQDQWENIMKHVPCNVFIHVHSEQNNNEYLKFRYNYKEKRLKSYFGEELEAKGLKNIYLEYKLATKQLDVIDHLQKNEIDLNTYAAHLVKFLKEKIETNTWDGKLKEITETTICNLIEKNANGRYNQYILDIFNCTKNYLLNEIVSSLVDHAQKKNNYNIDLIREIFRDANFSPSNADIKAIYIHILNSTVNENIKKEWIKSISLNISLKNYIEICTDKKYARSLLYKKLSFKAQLTFFLGKPFFFWFPGDMTDVKIRTLLGSIIWLYLYFLEFVIVYGLWFEKFNNTPFWLRRFLLTVNFPPYFLLDRAFLWKYWQKDVILKETKII